NLFENFPYLTTIITYSYIIKQKIYQYQLCLIPNTKLTSFDTIDNNDYLSYNYTYDQLTGRLNTIQSTIHFNYPNIYEIFIKDRSITILKRKDNYQRLKETTLTFKNQKQVTIEYIYDNKRLLFEQIKIQIGTKSIIHYDYKYDLLERIIEIRKNNIIKYHYEYDLNGNINRTNEYESIHYNK
ncbi:unnamed protein product, partial [Didymodactylos carnosus]